MAHPERSNLLFVFSDQHRWCDLGCYGNREVHSPHLDEFAATGLRFTTCISNSPLCVPIRGTLLTGRYALRHGAITNDLPMRHDVPTIAHVLRAGGYHTGYIGKWHLAGVPRDQPIPAAAGRFGFEEWKVCNCNHHYMAAYYYDEENRRIPIEGYEPIAQTDLAIDFIRRNRARRPWALVLSWGSPHDPYRLVPEPYLRRYDGRELPLRPNVTEVVAATPTRRLTRADLLRYYQGYYAQITALDDQFGRLLAALRATDQLARTVVIYTSDHGDMLGSHGYLDKQLPHEESIRVPLIAGGDERLARGVCDEMIGLVDLPVSLMALLGLHFPEEVDGADLHRLFLAPEAKGLDECYLYDLVPCHQAAARNGREWRGIRTRHYTYARTASDEGFVLFDNGADPYQLRNRIADPDHQALKVELMRRLDRHIARNDALLPWEELLRRYGLKEAWNRSQAYFGLPLLD